MSQQTFAMDSRLPVPDNMSPSDPAHPRNVTRNSVIIQNQAAADTKYDPYPPPRVDENFVGSSYSHKHYTRITLKIFIFVFSLLLLTMTVGSLMGSKMFRNVQMGHLAVLAIIIAVLGYMVVNMNPMRMQREGFKPDVKAPSKKKVTNRK